MDYKGLDVLEEKNEKSESRHQTIPTMEVSERDVDLAL